MVTAAVYARISEDRTGRAAGVGRQESDCRGLCERLGWDVGGVYVDNDVSAYRGRTRPAYERMLADLKDKRVDAIVVWHPDRLTRSLTELERLIEVIDATDAQCATVVAGDYDLSTATGKMVARILGATARAESERMGERIRRAHDERAAAGLPHGGGPRPFGFAADRVSVLDDEAHELRLMAERVLAGWSLRSVAVDLQHRGVKTTTGREWTGKLVSQTLSSPRVAGLRKHRGKVLGTGSWPAVIDADTWHSVQAVLHDPARAQGRRPRRYLLTGVLRCWKCGGRLMARPSDGAHTNARYLCRPRSDGGCGGVAVAVAGIDTHVGQLVCTRFDTLPAAPDQTGPVTDTAALEARRVELAEMWGAGDISRGEYLAARQAIEDRLQAAQRAVAGSRAPVLRSVPAGSLGATWDGLPFHTQRAFIDALVDRIVVGPVVVRGWNQYDGRRILQPPGEVAWRV